MARRALLIANGNFADEQIPPLKSPVTDAKRLSQLISRENVGDYEVTICADQDSVAVRKAIQRFFDNAAHDDLALVFISGHGIKDSESKLHFATADTELDALNATSVESRFVIERMDSSLAAKKIMFIDTCFSGAFARGTINKSAETVTKADFGISEAKGKAVFTASNSVQYAGERMIDGSAQSVFTRHLIEGIESGAADPASSGEISLQNLFHYIVVSLKSEGSTQRPQPFYTGLDGSVVIARNPEYRAAELSNELLDLIGNRDRFQRLIAVEDLQKIASSGAREAKLARDALIKLTEDDSQMVSEMARKAVDRLGVASVVPKMQPPQVVKPEPESDPAVDPHFPTKLLGKAIVARNWLTGALQAITAFDRRIVGSIVVGLGLALAAPMLQEKKSDKALPPVDGATGAEELANTAVEAAEISNAVASLIGKWRMAFDPMSVCGKEDGTLKFETDPAPPIAYGSILINGKRTELSLPSAAKYTTTDGRLFQAVVDGILYRRTGETLEVVDARKPNDKPTVFVRCK